MNEKQTAGKIYTDLKAKIQDKATVQEFVEVVGNDFMPKLMAMIEKDKKKADTDFFVEVCISMHPLLAGVPQYFMISRIPVRRHFLIELYFITKKNRTCSNFSGWFHRWSSVNIIYITGKHYVLMSMKPLRT